VNTILLTILPITIIGLILLQKTNASIQGDGMKIPASPLTKRIQILISGLVVVFLACSLYYSQQLHSIKMEKIAVEQEKLQQALDIEKQKLLKPQNKSFIDLINK